MYVESCWTGETGDGETGQVSKRGRLGCSLFFSAVSASCEAKRDWEKGGRLGFVFFIVPLWLLFYVFVFLFSLLHYLVHSCFL